MIIICDQFETFFDLHPSQSSRKAFLNSVAACVNDYSLACKFLIVVREDRLSRITEFEFNNGIPQPLELLKRDELPLFSEVDAEVVLREQAQRAGLNWSDPLIALLVADLSQDERVRPIDLQIAATALALSGSVTVDDYMRYGRSQGLIVQYVTLTLDLLRQPEPGARSIPPEQMQRVLLTLISADDTPRRLTRTVEEIATISGLQKALIEEIVARLARGRLVRHDRTIQEARLQANILGIKRGISLQHDQSSVELVHDRLVDLVLNATRKLGVGPSMAGGSQSAACKKRVRVRPARSAFTPGDAIGATSCEPATVTRSECATALAVQSQIWRTEALWADNGATVSVHRCSVRRAVYGGLHEHRA